MKLFKMKLFKMKLFTFFSVLLLFSIYQVKAQTNWHNIANTNFYKSNIAIVTNTYNDTCLGALIHPLWVVTSSTCALKTLTDDKRVFFITTAQILDIDHGTFIENIYIHPHFSEDPLDNDVALIKLATPADKTIRILKIIKNKYTQDFRAKKAITYGHDDLRSNSLKTDSFLKISRVVIFNNELCSRYPVSVSDTRFCGFPAVGCEGDEGGPVVLDDQLIGVTSINPIQAALCYHNIQYCNSLFPVTTFTKLEPYRGWLINVTGLTII